MKKKKIITLKQLKELRKVKPLICKDCKLYNAKEKVCSVSIIHNGEYFELKTEPKDVCMWDKMGINVQRMRSWHDDKNGYLEIPND